MGAASQMWRRVLLFLLVCGVSATHLSEAQTASPTGAPPVMTLEQAIQYATDHYPAVRAALEQVAVSAAAVDIAKAAYLPRLDSVLQANRATANNVFGQLFPQGVIPGLTGPVLPSASSDSVWSSAAGALLSWEALDFGLRHSTALTAQAGVTQARAAETLTRLEAQSAAADAFLRVVAAERALVAAKADLNRRDILLRSVQTLVNNQLRPGVDASRAEAERAAAQVRLIQAEQAALIARATLTRVLGMTTGEIAVNADSVLSRLPPQDIPTAAPPAHPLAQLRQAAVAKARAAEETVARSDDPRVFVLSSVFTRGSGANPNGVFDGGAGGLRFDRVNWAAGVQVVFPNVFDFGALRARKAAAAASERATAALYDEALVTVSSEQRTSAALLETTRAIAANTPVQLAAAQQTETRARARYDAGLATIVEVADAQSLLAQAEVQNELARVDVWRAMLAVAVAQGDLASFVNLVRQP